MGWPTGLEPATTRTTIWSSTIELRPPSLRCRTEILGSESLFAKKRTRFSHSARSFWQLCGTLDRYGHVDYHRASSSNEANWIDLIHLLLFPGIEDRKSTRLNSSH